MMMMMMMTTMMMMMMMMKTHERINIQRQYFLTTTYIGPNGS